MKPPTKRRPVSVLPPLAVASSAYSTTEPSDCASTTSSSSACKTNITIDYLVNEMKKTLAPHIACSIADLSKLPCNDCEIDDPNQRRNDCLLPDDVLLDMHFDEAMDKVSSVDVRSFVGDQTEHRIFETLREGRRNVGMYRETIAELGSPEIKHFLSSKFPNRILKWEMSQQTFCKIL